MGDVGDSKPSKYSLSRYNQRYCSSKDCIKAMYAVEYICISGICQTLCYGNQAGSVLNDCIEHWSYWLISSLFLLLNYRVYIGYRWILYIGFLDSIKRWTCLSDKDSDIKHRIDSSIFLYVSEMAWILNKFARALEPMVRHAHQLYGPVKMLSLINGFHSFSVWTVLLILSSMKGTQALYGWDHSDHLEFRPHRSSLTD